MFAKSKEDMKKQAPSPQAPSRVGIAATPSIIGSDVRIEGNVKTSGELQLDGEIKGDLNCGGLVMGESGSVIGLITADNVTIRGTVKGEIRAKTVRLEKSAVVDGDVYHETMSVESGAKLTGRFAHTANPADKSAPAGQTASIAATTKAAE